MAAQFESLTDPFVIMFSIPFAFTGIILGLAITQTPLGVMALIGLIMLMGIVVKNGIVLIDYTILCRERGMGILTAVVTAGKSRLRPVLDDPPFDYRIGYDPDGCRNRRRLGNVAFDGYDGCMGTFGINIDHPGNRTGRIQCICRKRSPAQTPQDGKNGISSKKE